MTEYAVPRRPPERVAQPNGWWGIAIFVAGEATLFGAFLATYWYLRFKAVHWPPPGIPEPKLTLPLVLTGILVATSVPMEIAARAARAGRRGPLRAALLLALVVQAGYFAMQVHLFLGDADKVAPQKHAYGSIYVTLLGAHHAHVAVGALLTLWFLLRFSTGTTRYRVNGLRAATFYWHFVNAMAILVTLTVLSPSL